MSARLDRLCIELVRHEKAVRRAREQMTRSSVGLPDEANRTPEVLAWIDAADAGDRVLDAIEDERQALRDEAEAYEIEAAR